MGRRAVVVVASLAILGAVLAPTASGAGEPAVQRFEEPWFTAFPDEERGLVVLVNLTRDLVCTDAQVADELAFLAWLEGGEVGPPPEPTAEPFQGIAPATVQVVETGKGALVFTLRARDMPMELWPLDEDAPLVGPCTDTEESDTPYAVGTAQFRVNDNDLEVSGTRGNAFGDHGHALLRTVDGTPVHAHWRFHVNDRCYGSLDLVAASCFVTIFEIR